MKEDKVYLQNILECILKIEKYTSNGEEDFMTSSLVQDGVIRNLEIIGEARKRISGNLRDQNQDIPWREMAGLRDILIHNYMGVDLRTVWNVVIRELPRLKPQLEKLLS